MSIEGWYYLHTNGNLIHKAETGETAADIRESDFARCMWPMDPSDRMGAWNILVEGLALGADADRVSELANRWHCDDADADIYAERMGITFTRDGAFWCATGPGFTNLQESPSGFGVVKLSAMAELAKAMGLPAGKMWRTTFADLLSQSARAAA